MGGGPDRDDERRTAARPADAADLRRLVNPLALTDVNLEAGAAIFSARCAGCHGVEGAGAAPRMATPGSGRPVVLAPRPHQDGDAHARRRGNLYRHRRRRGHQPRHAGLRRPGGDGALAAGVLRAEPWRRPPSRPRHRRRRRLSLGSAAWISAAQGAGRQPDEPRRRSSSAATCSTTRGCRPTARSRAAPATNSGWPSPTASRGRSATAASSSARRDGARQRRLPPGADLGRSDRAAARGAGAGADVRRPTRWSWDSGDRARAAGPAGAEPRYPAMFAAASPASRRRSASAT